MYFDFEDQRPDAPRLESAFSRRESVVYSVLGHGLLILALVYLPQVQWIRDISERARIAAEERQRLFEEQQRQRDEARFVFVQPRVDTPAPAPPPLAELSDQDRRAQTVERAPDPTNPLPFALGNSSERVEAEPSLQARSQGAPSEVEPAAPQPPGAGESGNRALREPESGRMAYARPDAGQTGAPPAGALGAALQNLQRYIQQESFNNPEGGAGGFGPSIQFDTKGVEFGPWIRRFIAQIKRNWFIPNAAMFFKGHVVVTFFVHKDGRITDVTVLQPSAVDAFNSSALNAMLASDPTQPLPPEYPADEAFFTVTFYFNENPPAQ
jgi:TonB family protein